MADIAAAEGDAPVPVETAGNALPEGVADGLGGGETERNDITLVPTDEENDASGMLSLATDRVDTAALDSLFTERTEGDADEEQEQDGPSETPHPLSNGGRLSIEMEEEVGEEPCADDERPALAPELNDETPKSREPSRASSPFVLQEPQLSPTRPSLPARPPRPSAVVPPPQVLSAPNPVPGNAAQPPLQLITFDVGGKLFRCKASLVAKFPDKRLHHIVTCGCEQIDDATFFIDRNPQHFEIILDWYRTGKCLRPLPAHVNEDTLRDDAKYFDLLEEMFPPTPTPSSSPPAIPPRPKGSQHQKDSPPTTALPRLPDRPARPPVPATPLFSPPQSAVPQTITTAKAQSSSKNSFRYSKRDVRVVTTAEGSPAPNWFSVRDHEHLIIESAKGTGKLLVRVTDATGLMHVFVDQAVLFDSRSWFYLEEDGRARLQHCVLPGSHVYTFWVEPTGDQASSPPPPSKAVKQQGTKSTKGPPSAPTATAPSKPELEVVFRLVSTFSRADEMEEADAELTAMLCAKGKGWGDPSVVAPLSGAGRPRCLFLPPRPDPPTAAVHTGDLNCLDERDAIAEEIRALAAKERLQQTSVVATDPPDVKGTGGLLKRGGAAIALPQKANKPGHGNEKVTVYQPIPPAAETPRSPAKQPLTTYAAQQPRQFRQR